MIKRNRSDCKYVEINNINKLQGAQSFMKNSLSVI
jgi:hypothetical protein